ncbi:DUF488 family protein [Telluribacter sp.]|jgi:uncharacterized protein YwgA|uniref:DUF488 domain-containing protein n=1 Tax=Telluribacter sp. TaxID=1978767 RepID=UPI002E11F356|nr:DUF488 family protein [Telluribacter sp.]
MYYRRKILLSLLQVFDNRLERVQLQKLLFLFSQLQKSPDYEFVPYKFGCFSFQANADLFTLAKYGLVSKQEESWKKVTNEDFTTTLKKRDNEILNAVRLLYESSSTDELISITYKKYPYYAINSVIASKILNSIELAAVQGQTPKNDEYCLYTIGYEGISLEGYLNKLIQLDIKVLCDVRKNSFSMKFGFSKAQLKNACEGVSILFYHLPEVGIESDQRKELNNQSDYDILFENYKRTIVPKTTDTQQFIINLLTKYQRVALTCFEAQSCQCHRSHLAEAISQLPEFHFSLKHI